MAHVRVTGDDRRMFDERGDLSSIQFKGDTTMTSTTATTKSGKTVFLPTMDAEFESAMMDGNTGFCIACGADADGVEPDARKYECESCSEPRVYGLEELVLMGYVR